MVKLQKDTLKEIVQSIINTRPEEVGCDMCIDKLAKFVERELAGENVAELMPMIKHHLDSCLGCEEEYEALLDSINSVGAVSV